MPFAFVLLGSVLAGVPALAGDPCPPVRDTSPPVEKIYEAVRYGRSMATIGPYWFVSDDNARTWQAPGVRTTGVVHVYERVDGQLINTQTIVPEDADSFGGFGYNMSTDGQRLIVGASGLGFTWPGPLRRIGTAIIYELEDDQWVETGRLEPHYEVSGMGRTVSISGDIATASVSNEGTVHVYQETAQGWEFRQVIESPDGLPVTARFGEIVAFNGPWLFIAAYEDATVISSGGSVYVYRQVEGGLFEFTQKIAASERLRLGVGLGFDGTTLAVGAPLADPIYTNQGVVQIYELDGELWVLQQEVTHSRAARNHAFGKFVTLENGVLMASAGETVPGSTQVVYAFRRDDEGVWREVARLVPKAPWIATGFGLSMATDGRFMLAASRDIPDRYTSTTEGATYFYDLACFDCFARIDLDGDGVLTIFDFLTFQTAFGTGDMAADFDGDGQLTIFDFLAFQTAFAEGCE